MAHFGLPQRRRRELEFLQFITILINIVLFVYLMWHSMRIKLYNSKRIELSKRDRIKFRMRNLNRIIRDSDVLCRNHLRMNRRTFYVLCEMLRDIGGLKGTKNMSLEEIVTSFLYTVAHHKKNRTIASYFYRSGESVSRQFHSCLQAILKLHVELLKKPSPITEDCEDDRWKYFKNCLGALDGTMISVNVPCEDRSKYRTRKGSIAMNVLGVCSPDMEFIYILPGWEGSSHDGRVLRDAISRPNGLRVPNGFRNGYMVKLEEMVNKAIPGCGLRATPHIDSRLKTLVGKYSAITQMLKKSGFKWNDEEKMIAVDKKVYDEYCKVHTNAKNLYGVRFPHLNELSEIYGNDYATGTSAEGFIDAVKNIEKEGNVELVDSSDEDVDTPREGSQSANESAPPLKKLKRDNNEKKRRTKKVSETSTVANHMSGLQAFMKDMNNHLSTMANAWSRSQEREQEIADLSNKVLDNLLNLEGLTTGQALQAANALTAEPNKLVIYFRCPDSLKLEYVKDLLGIGASTA